MVSFGLIDEWNPIPGTLVSWVASPHSRARAAQAPAHPTPPSHQQEEYLKSAHRNRDTDFRFSRLCLVSFDVPGTLDRDAMTEAVNAFLLRHDTFLSWFALTPDGQVQRHVVDPDDVEFVATDHGRFADADAIRAHVQQETPGPFRWDCFTFGVVERDDSFTCYLAADHLNTDGVSQAISGIDILQLYGNAVWHNTGGMAHPGSYLDYCERERKHSAQLTPDSPGVRTWIDLLRRNGGDLPSFPLDLGRDRGGYTRTAHRTVGLFGEADALRFEQVCLDHGARFTGGIFAAAALAERQLVGSDYYFGLTPINTRTSGPEFASVGWFSTLIPIAFPLGPETSFAELVPVAQRAHDDAKDLTDVSFHRVLELVTPDSGIVTRPGWIAPMLSYVDGRKLLGNEIFDAIKGGVFGNRGASEDVYLWINRFADVTSMTVLYPDTAVAHDAIDRYLATLAEVFTTVAATADHG